MSGFPPIQLQDQRSAPEWTCPKCGKDALFCEHAGKARQMDITERSKRDVITRLYNADAWLDRNSGEPLRWVRDLLRDAAQALENQPSALWCQWMTGPHSNVRMFVTGEFGPDQLDSFLELLNLQRSWMSRRSESATSAGAVDPVLSNSHEPSTRDKGF